VILSWSTATETNNMMFEVERKKEDSEYSIVGYVEGNGTTTEIQEYLYTDRDVQPGKYNYRLKQIDYDGTFEYSNEIEVNVAPVSFSLEQNYPNPFNPITSIEYAVGSIEYVSLKVYDVLGVEITTLVNEEKEPGVYKAIFDASNLSSGTYFYKLQARDNVMVRKMILMR
jgi:hypothetical protein